MRASRIAIARPIPCAAPVTIATLPLSRTIPAAIWVYSIHFMNWLIEWLLREAYLNALLNRPSSRHQR